MEAEGPKLLADTLWEPGAWKGTQRGLCPVPVQPKGTFAGLLSLQVPKGGSVCLRFKEAPLAWRVEWKEQTGASLARGGLAQWHKKETFSYRWYVVMAVTLSHTYT